MKLYPGDNDLGFLFLAHHCPDDFDMLAGNHGKVSAHQGIDRRCGAQGRAGVPCFFDNTLKDEDI
jgi:hypothetical protein